MKLRRTYQRALARVVDSTGGVTNNLEDLGETLQPVLAVSSFRDVVAVDAFSVSAVSATIPALAGNSAVLGYQAPGQGARVMCNGPAARDMSTIDSGGALPVIAPGGALKGQFNPVGPPPSGTVTFGHTLDARFLVGSYETPAFGIPSQWYELDPGKTIFLHGIIGTDCKGSILIIEYPPLSVA